MARTIKGCRNCGRERAIIGDGLDSSCYWAVYKKFTKGTPEYDAALLAAKIKYSDPNYKRKGGRRPESHLTKPIAPANIKKLKTNAVKSRPQMNLAMEKFPLIKHNAADPEMSGVIATIQMERERLLAKADKLAQAIDDGDNQDIYAELKKRDEAGRKAIELVEKIFEASDTAETHDVFAANTLKLLGAYLL